MLLKRHRDSPPGQTAPRHEHETPTSGTRRSVDDITSDADVAHTDTLRHARNESVETEVLPERMSLALHLPLPPAY